MAREDCLGPNVLNGLAMVTGNPKEKKYDKAIESELIFDAEYGDCGTRGCLSSIGIFCAVP